MTDGQRIHPDDFTEVWSIHETSERHTVFKYMVYDKMSAEPHWCRDETEVRDWVETLRLSHEARAVLVRAG